MPRYHPFFYFVRPHDSQRSARTFQVRDALALLELQPALEAEGFRYGEAIFNPPRENGAARSARKGQLSVDRSRLGPGDLIVQTTRPPLSDEWEQTKKRIESGSTDLEVDLFGIWKQHLQMCSRRQVNLVESEDDPPGARRMMEFLQKECAPFKKVNDGNGWYKPPEPRTAAFLLRLEEAWENGPGYLCVFGMDGTSTLVWAHRLRRDLSHLLARPGFVVADIECPAEPGLHTDLSWSDNLRIDVVLARSPLRV